MLPAGRSRDTTTPTATQRNERAQSKKAAQKKRLIPHENAIIFLTQFLIYLDGYTSHRSDDSGRFEKNLDIVGV